jgi:small conductance mechanosensitive channel
MVAPRDARALENEENTMEETVESQIVIAADSDPEVAITAIARGLAAYPDMAEGSDPQVGIHDFSYGGIILGLRYWVPSSLNFKIRFEVNRAAYAALKGAESS